MRVRRPPVLGKPQRYGLRQVASGNAMRVVDETPDPYLGEISFMFQHETARGHTLGLAPRRQ